MQGILSLRLYFSTKYQVIVHNVISQTFQVIETPGRHRETQD